MQTCTFSEFACGLKHFFVSLDFQFIFTRIKTSITSLAEKSSCTRKTFEACFPSHALLKPNVCNEVVLLKDETIFCGVFILNSYLLKNPEKTELFKRHVTVHFVTARCYKNMFCKILNLAQALRSSFLH